MLSSTPALYIVSTLFWGWFGLSCMLLYVGGLALWLVTLPFDRNRRLLHLYSCFWAASYMYVNPLWRLDIVGTRIDRSRPFMIVSNHQSLGDVLVLFATYLPFKWVSKASVFKVPFLGWNMRLNGYVPLRRGDRASIGRMSAACLDWLGRGVSVLMFPEGTRTTDGEIQPFKMGAFRIAREAKVPVLPLILDGTASALPKHGLLLRGYSVCRVRVLEPIDVSAHPSDEDAAAAVRAVMVAALERLRAETAAPASK